MGGREQMEGKGQGDVSTVQTVREFVTGAEDLFRKHIELAQAELKANVRAEARAFGALGIGALTALIAATLFLVTGALALATVMRPWIAGLVVSCTVAVVAGAFAAIGWQRRVRQPLLLTREALERDARWMKERLA